MKQASTIFLIVLSIFVLSSCCNCDSNDPDFSQDERDWVPDHEVSDSVIFSNGDSLRKTLYVKIKDEGVVPCKLAGPGCCCPEDDNLFLNYALYGDEIPGTNGMMEGLTISINKTDHSFSKSIGWSCNSVPFHEFDYTLDSLTVNETTYYQVFVKELSVCNISSIYFCKKIGLIQFEQDNISWQKLN